MSDRAIAWLKPAADSFWKWDDDGRRVAWQSGETIAFWPELVGVVSGLAPAGLPPLSAILLLLASTRDGWNHCSKHLQTHAEQLAQPGGGDTTTAIGITLRAIGHRLESDASSLITRLDRVAALPAELRHPLVAKAVLAEMVFENQKPVLEPDLARHVLAELRSGADPGAFDLRRPGENALREWIACIDALKKGVTQIDADRFRLRLRTGLDRLIQPTRQELGPSQRVRRLMGEPTDDADLAGLFRFARSLLPVVQVPRTLRHQDPVQSGGVADITNRGQLDRLLISELAGDDLTLAVRVAVNQALYIQRESPHHDPPRKRIILIDCGIRLWGVPRVYATAVALALAANGEPDAELSVFRPDGKKLLPVELSDREGVLSHLESLDIRPHFAAALPAFFEQSSQSDHESESFLITNEEVLDDPEFKAAFQQLDRFICYAATVARDGAFRLWSLKSSGRALLRQAMLDVDLLLAEPIKAPVRSPLQPVMDLPVILSVDPFPLLLPPGFRVKRFIESRLDDHHHERVAITHDRRLINWSSPNQGAQILSDRVPKGRLELFRFTRDAKKVIAVFMTDGFKLGCTLWVINLQPTRVAAPIELMGIDQRPVGFELRDETVYIIFEKKAAAYGLDSAEAMGALDTSQYRWDGGRFYHSGRFCFMLSWGGSRLMLTTAGIYEAGKTFEVTDFPNPLFMDDDGAIRTAFSGRETVVPAILEKQIFLGVRADGRAIISCTAEKTDERWSLAFDGELKWVREDAPLLSVLQCNSQQAIHLAERYSIRRRFSGVMISGDGHLLLVCRANKVLQPRMAGRHLMLVPHGVVTADPHDSVRCFKNASAPPGAGYRLKAVSWDGRGRVFLDSRGLLHLKSSNRRIPEVTIVLVNQGPLAGWSSDGRVYGPKYFHGSDVSHDPGHLADLIQQFTQSLR